jgi:hypothetical protein
MGERSLTGRPWARLLAALVAGVMVVTAPPAAAIEATDKLAAQQLLNQGNQLVTEGDYIAALEAFRAAYARYPSPKILLNMGTTLRQLGRNVEAAEAYETYLRDPDADPARSEELQRILREIDAVSGHVQIDVEGGPAAVVRLDGKQIEGFRSGAKIRVEPGEHTFTAERDGAPPAVRTASVAPREETLVRLRFTTPEPPPKPVVAPAAPAAPPSTVQRTVALAVGGVGVAGLGVGSMFAVLAKARNDEAEDHCLGPGACDADGVDLGGEAKSFAQVSTVAIALGAGALTTGIVLLITAPSSRQPARPRAGALRLTGGPTAGGAAVVVTGAW